MSSVKIPEALRTLVRSRAGGRCEYCCVHEEDTLLPHEPDHLIARQHGGATESDNLGYACFQCNRLKGPNIASLDPESGNLTPLFHPRQDLWREHMKLDGVRIVGLTAKGRATVQLFCLNAQDRIRVRQALIAVDRFVTPV